MHSVQLDYVHLGIVVDVLYGLLYCGGGGGCCRSKNVQVRIKSAVLISIPQIFLRTRSLFGIGSVFVYLQGVISISGNVTRAGSMLAKRERKFDCSF